MTQVLDKGILELKQVTSQADFSVVAAARVSNGVYFDEASKGEEADQKLISYLLKHNHGTPFEHNLFTFYVKCPLFVRSEWHRHRIGWSYNEISGRYVEYEPEFYVPSRWRMQGTTNKQGSFIPEESLTQRHWDDGNTFQLEEAVKNSYQVYLHLLQSGVAKEMARMVLPVNLYTQFYATCNARSLMHFLDLRTADNAQFEIKMYALAMENIFAEQMPMTYNAWKQLRLNGGLIGN